MYTEKKLKDLVGEKELLIKIAQLAFGTTYNIIYDIAFQIEYHPFLKEHYEDAEEYIGITFTAALMAESTGKVEVKIYPDYSVYVWYYYKHTEDPKEKWHLSPTSNQSQIQELINCFLSSTHPEVKEEGGDYSIEAHGDGYALYKGRSEMQHGLNLCFLSDFDKNGESTRQLIVNALNGNQSAMVFDKDGRNIDGIRRIFAFDTFICCTSGINLKEFMMKKHSMTEEMFNEYNEVYKSNMHKGDTPMPIKYPTDEWVRRISDMDGKNNDKAKWLLDLAISETKSLNK